MECMREMYNEKIEKNVLKLVKTMRAKDFSVQNVEDVIYVYKHRQRLAIDPLGELQQLRVRLHPDKNKFAHTQDAFIVVNEV